MSEVFEAAKGNTASQDRKIGGKREDNIIDGNPGDKVENRKSLLQHHQAIIFLGGPKGFRASELHLGRATMLNLADHYRRNFAHKSQRRKKSKIKKSLKKIPVSVSTLECPSFLPFPFTSRGRLSDCQRA